MPDKTDLVRVETDAGVAHWTLSRPESLNAFDRALLDALAETIEAARQDASIRCAIVTGAGDRAFSAGADLKERRGMTLDETRQYVQRIGAVFEALAQLPFPTVAAVNGVAFGGGLELALACDLRIFADHVRVGLTEVSVGIMPGAGGTQRLPRLVGVAVAKEMIFTAARIDAGEALRIGLANRVVPQAELPAAARAVATQIAAQAPLAVRQSKQAIDAGLAADIATGLGIENAAYQLLVPTRDRVEGLQAFAEKRKPRYRGE